MEIGFSQESFGNLLMLSLFLSLITVALLMYYLKHRGEDIYKRSTSFWITFGPFLLFLIIPFWLADLPLKVKIIGTSIATGIGIANFFAIDRAQRALWKAKGIDPSKGRPKDNNNSRKDQGEKKPG